MYLIGLNNLKINKMNIQDELQKIHHQYDTTEKANYEIQKLFDRELKSKYSDEEVFRLTLDSLDLGMRIRQDQLSGYSKESGKELHNKWFEKFKKK